MKKIQTLIFLMLFLGINQLNAQNNNVLLTIDDQEINKEEFLRIYNKNNKNLEKAEESTIDEYLELFINFKLKVLEAEKMGMDTLASVRKELSKYRKELAKPYLVDNETIDSLVREAYRRSKYEVNASHILIKTPPKASAEDTLRIYNKTKNIKERIVLKKEDFNAVALSTSDDPSVKRNKGNLGYFSALQMVYPFENAVYKMNIGEISNPVKTKYGYHIIKKNDQRKSEGKVKVAHIMLLAPNRMGNEKINEKKEQINKIYHKIKQGADFNEMAKKYSEDRSSSKKGGELPWFGVGRMVPKFEKVAFQLREKGQISKPFKTRVGWHIIKLIDKDQPGPFNQEEKELRKKISNNPRYEIAKDSLVRDLKKEYDYKFFPENLNKFSFYINMKTHKIKWDSLKNNFKANDPLFKINQKTYGQQEFLEYFTNQKSLRKQFSGKLLLDNVYDSFEKEKILDLEYERLPEKYPKYRYIVQEYHDGILLFEIMDKKVWSKATKDTVGLKKYHKEHKSNYMWDERFQGKIYVCQDKETLDKVKKLKKGGLFRKSYTDQELLNEINEKNQEKLTINKDIFQKGENPLIDKEIWNLKRNIPDDKQFYYITGEKIEPEPKKLKEARGQIVSDYQDYLEEQWIKKLRNKYNIQINHSVLNEIKE